MVIGMIIVIKIRQIFTIALSVLFTLLTVAGCISLAKMIEECKSIPLTSQDFPVSVQLLKQEIKNDIYRISLPSDWTVEKFGYELQFIKSNKRLGGLSMYIFYPWDEKLGYLTGNHKEIIEDRQLGKDYSFARFIRLLRDKPAAQHDNTLTEEIHIFFIERDYSIAFDLMFFKESVDYNSIMNIAKTFKQNYKEFFTQPTNDAKSANHAGSWMKEASIVYDEINTTKPTGIDITFNQEMDESSLTPFSVIIYDVDYKFKRSMFFRCEYTTYTRTLHLRFLTDWYYFEKNNGIIVYVTSKVRNIKGKEMGQTYFLKFDLTSE
jgi:hypothetical protein